MRGLVVEFLPRFQLCQTLCDFTDLESDLEAKEVKLAVLQDLDSVFADKSLLVNWPPGLFQAFHRMVIVNLFRELPPVPPSLLAGIDEPVFADVAWSHLQPVYSLLLKYQQANPRDSRFDLRFCKLMIGNLHASDRNERELVLLYISRYIAARRENQCPVLSKFHYMLHLYLEGAICPWPVTNILRFYASHYQDPGMNSPFYRNLFRCDLAALLTARHVSLFYQPLTSLLEAIVEADPPFAVRFVDDAIKRWPLGAPAKQPVFLNVITFLLERTPRHLFERFVPRVFVFLARCVRSPHAQVAMLALRVWSNARIAANIAVFASQIAPCVADAVGRVSTSHWDPAVRRAAAETVVALAVRPPGSAETHDVARRRRDTSGLGHVRNPPGRMELEWRKQWEAVAGVAAVNDQMAGPRLLSRWLEEVASAEQRGLAWAAL
jgi:serine/threonine-protein phosphatase 2A regulatory subunit B'